jgi:UDP-glucuronate 4-epimerase
MDFIAAIEAALGREAQKNFLPLQAGDVPATAADTTELAEWVGFAPATPVREGVARFVAWYRDYYGR